MRRLLLLLVLGSVVNCGAPSGVNEELEQQIRTLAEQAITEEGIVGLSIGVALDGEIVFQEGFGYIDEARTVPATAETGYDAGSIGKQFTAAAILQLVERGELSLDQSVRSIVPNIPSSFPDATIEQLLRHTSGFVSYEVDVYNAPADYLEPRYGEQLLTDTELLQGEALFPPGETFVYSNPGYVLLGLVIEAISGQRYDHYIRDELLADLEPHSMLVCDDRRPPEGSDRFARTSDGIEKTPYLHMSSWGGSGSVFATVTDLLRWSKALNDGAILEPASLQAFRSPTRLQGRESSVEVPYGMAQRIGLLQGHPKVGHTGTFVGGSAALADYPDDALEIVVLSNTYGGGAPHARALETTIAKWMLEISDPDIRALGVPISGTQRQMIEGSYSQGDRYEAAIEGNELVVSSDGEEVERLVHLGDLLFRHPERPEVFQRFALDGARAGWWIYNESGNFVEVLRRIDSPSPGVD